MWAKLLPVTLRGLSDDMISGICFKITIGRWAGKDGSSKTGHRLITVEPEYSLQTSLLVHVCNFPLKKFYEARKKIKNL